MSPMAMAPSATTSPATTALMTVVMMAAMMLPSVTPTLWHYHHRLRASRLPSGGRRTALFATGYVAVWVTIGLALFAMGAGLSPMGMASPAEPSFAPWTVAAVVLCAGALQRSRWKATQLIRCREVCLPAPMASASVTTAWRDGVRFGIGCGLSCTAPMAVLFVAGLMDTRMMIVVTAAITAERVAPGGTRIARWTGGLAIVAGVILSARAIAVGMSGLP